MTPPDENTHSIGGVAPIQTADDLSAAIYARTSSPSQEHGYSINEQVRQCWERCEQLGWSVSHVFRDEAVSGKNPDREMFQKLLDGAEAGWYDVVLVWKLDRFSRSLMHAVQIERQLRDWDVGLHSVTEHIDTTTPTGRFNFRNISSASELERELGRQRTQMGFRALAADGKWPNDKPPLGYKRREDGRLEINPSEAELVREIFNRYIELKSMPDVASELNSAGRETKQGNEWTPHTVGEVLKNELYRGEYSVAGVEKHIGEYRIVSDDLYNRVVEIRHRFRSGASERTKMPEERKQQRIQNIRSQYEKYLKI